MITYYYDYWRDLTDQEQGSKPLDKVEIEMTTNVWTDITDYYLGGASFSQEKERAPDKISAGDTRYSMDNSNNYFTPSDASSIFYGATYIGKRVKFSIGFYGIGYFTQSITKIKDIKWDYDEQVCYILCQEILQRIIDESINVYPSALVPVANAGNTGNGKISKIQTKPFATVSENWTVTCTLGGGSGVATFTATGSVSGLSGTTWTSNTENSDSTFGIKFEITAGAAAWVIGDSFTFTTYAYPQWTTTNPAKIIWGILTGYNYDTDVQENWSARVLNFDHTQSDSNTDINYNSFVDAVAGISNTLTGYVSYDEKCSSVIEGIIIHFLGSIYSDNKGRISLSTFAPTLGAAVLREFSDDKKVFSMNAEKDTAKIINQVTVHCKSSASWAWSDDDEELDDIYSNTNSSSISTYGVRNPFEWDDNWYSANRAAQEWFADRLIDKFGNPPLEIEFETGLDAIRMNLSNIFNFNDSRTGLGKTLELNKIDRDFESQPKTIKVIGSDAITAGYGWCFLGSSVSEADHDWSVAASQTYDTATDWERQ